MVPECSAETPHGGSWHDSPAGAEDGGGEMVRGVENGPMSVELGGDHVQDGADVGTLATLDTGQRQSLLHQPLPRWSHVARSGSVRNVPEAARGVQYGEKR